jgi:hypothetical protein
MREKLPSTFLLFRWLRNLSVSCMRKIALYRIGHERKCPWCRTWSGEMFGVDDYIRHDNKTDAFKCRKCGRRSEWELHGPIAVCLGAACQEQGPTNE